MPTYYEVLNIPVSSSSQEIEIAVDCLYNEIRHRVTSFDPQISAKANQDLIFLEEIRNTLLNPQSRNNYDKAIGFIGMPGGLTDPNPHAVTSSNSMGVGLPNIREVDPKYSQTITSPKSSWTCLKCKKENLPNTAFCSRCGGIVGQNCPKCKTLHEVANADFCPSCGAHLRTEIRRYELEQAIKKSEAELIDLQNVNPTENGEVQNYRNAIAQALAWSTFAATRGIIELIFLTSFRFGYFNPGSFFYDNFSWFIAIAVIVVSIVATLILKSNASSTWGASITAIIGIPLLSFDFTFGPIFSGVANFFLSLQPSKFTGTVMKTQSAILLGRTISLISLIVLVGPIIWSYLFYDWVFGELLWVILPLAYFFIGIILVILCVRAYIALKETEVQLDFKTKERSRMIHSKIEEIENYQRELVNLPENAGS